MISQVRCTAVFSVMVWMSAAIAQQMEPDPLFQSELPLDITLEAPFATIDGDRDREQEYAGVLRYTDETGQEHRFDAALTVRGNWRLQKGNCRYSQLWVDLKRGQTADTIFANQNRLKLVVQCGTQDRYREYIAQEQQLYQVFAALSDLNFDTRLLNATYVDSEDTDSVRTHLAFFIEHQSRLKDRFNMADVELNSIAYKDLDPVQSTVMSIFMYLIGNTDYSMTSAAEGEECCHNAKLLVDVATHYYPLPYDFDASGYVDASYAPLPNPEFNLRNNRDRLYRGFCVSANDLDAAVSRFNSARERIMAIVTDTTYLSERTAQRNEDYVADFYEVLDNQRSLEREIIEQCRG